jgi:hypothetical protein
MSDGLAQTHGRDARATAEFQPLPTTGRCALSISDLHFRPHGDVHVRKQWKLP